MEDIQISSTERVDREDIQEGSTERVYIEGQHWGVYGEGRQIGYTERLYIEIIDIDGIGRIENERACRDGRHSGYTDWIEGLQGGSTQGVYIENLHVDQCHCHADSLTNNIK